MLTFAKIQSHLCYLLHTLVTTVARGSFSAALILLSPSRIIFSSEFAAQWFFTDTCVCVTVSQVKATCSQPK